MGKVEFSVGAKAARLIGRENIADVDGALIELIKNSYDADASCVMVKFNIPFLGVPSKISVGEFSEILSGEDFNRVLQYYQIMEDGILQKKELTSDDNSQLEEILSSYNSILIADNGSGMTYDTVTSSWMYIGTSDKEKDYLSTKGRIKTGAKGIGRFALDKLSRQSKMYTKNVAGEKTITWSMNWDQFANAKLISEVEADIDEVDVLYKDIVYGCFNDRKEVLDEYDWYSGTLIELTPTRELWNKRLFKKVNTNLRSINPIGTMDKFDVIIINDKYPEFSFRTEEVALDRDDYDYRIRILYDGNECYKVDLERNEVDFSVSNVFFEKYGETVKKDVEEFWNRKAFSLERYCKEKYSGEVSFNYNVIEVLPNDSLESIRKVGPFTAELYFLRKDNTDKYPIMKNVIRKKRKDITDKFSGIKIYRDSFKVRPYGDEGALMDWLDLGGRSQRSPAGVAHQDGAWRVEPYQLLGWVAIGRENNPQLEDMANREGLAQNESFYIFQDLILKGISEFEYDRQYIYREYAKWKKEVEDEIGSRHRNEQIIEAARDITKISQVRENKSEKNINAIEQHRFTEEEYLGAVRNLVEESEQKLNERQIMQILSSSGIVLNTFFHEFNAINTQFHVEAPQIRSRVKYILHNQEYTGVEAYNPYPRIDALEKNDMITAAFLDVVMEGLKKENLQSREIRLSEELGGIVDQWKAMLSEKHIFVEYACDADDVNHDRWSIPKVDLYIIINNFMLNSAWFLEETYNEMRSIKCLLTIRQNQCELLLSNNGPILDNKYQYNPNKIFELGETSKEKKIKDDKVVEGTGLGLWILKDTVERNKGTVEVLTPEMGFALKIVIHR